MAGITDAIAICIKAATLIAVKVPIMISRGPNVPMIGSRLIVGIVVRIISQIVIIYNILAAIVVEMHGIPIIVDIVIGDEIIAG